MNLRNRNIILIAGPCSAESSEQMMKTADDLIKHLRPDIFRAGIWKARTNINSFEGVGENALKWLTEVQSKYNLPVATEVLKPEHVELCLKYKINYLWLGARTVTNPFMVQEICNALKGSKTKIMVKNPVNPDIRLWAGALERVYNTGINDVIAIHRGFSTYYNTPYRNMPLWEIPNELKRMFPSLPVICDPSHICGKTHCLNEIIQQALDLEMDGLMIETHHNPVSAKSDKDQQLKPAELKQLLDNIIIRNRCESLELQLQNLRNEIDIIDNQLLEILARRLSIIEKIGDFKKKHNITILQSERSKFIFSDRMSKGSALNIQQDFLKSILKTIHNEAIRIQFEILSNESKEPSQKK